MSDTRRVAVIVLTFNRKSELLRTLDELTALPEIASVTVVDNASTDGTADTVARCFPHVQLVGLPENLGAAGRNAGVQAVDTPYIAFCDDDTWWERGSLTRGAEILDAYPRLAVLSARVLVGKRNVEDPTSARMAASPFPNRLGYPGTEVVGFMAGACIMRRQAFIDAGGYDPRFFVGGEEALLAIDFMVAGWHMGYSPELVVHHHPSISRNAPRRRQLLVRNALWCAWLRRPLSGALEETQRRLREARRERSLVWSVAASMRGMSWVLRERRVIPRHVEAALRQREAFDDGFSR